MCRIKFIRLIAETIIWNYVCLFYLALSLFILVRCFTSTMLHARFARNERVTDISLSARLDARVRSDSLPKTTNPERKRSEWMKRWMGLLMNEFTTALLFCEDDDDDDSDRFPVVFYYSLVKPPLILRYVINFAEWSLPNKSCIFYYLPAAILQVLLFHIKKILKYLSSK